MSGIHVLSPGELSQVSGWGILPVISLSLRKNKQDCCQRHALPVSIFGRRITWLHRITRPSEMQMRAMAGRRQREREIEGERVTESRLKADASFRRSLSLSFSPSCFFPSSIFSLSLTLSHLSVTLSAVFRLSLFLSQPLSLPLFLCLSFSLSLSDSPSVTLALVKDSTACDYHVLGCCAVSRAAP